MKNVSQYTMYALIAVGVISFVMAMSGSYDVMLGLMYIYFGIAVLAALVAAVYNAMIKPESLKQTGIGIGAMLLIFIVSYALADETVPQKYANTVSTTASKWTGTGLIAFYILFFISIGAIVVTGIMNVIKK